jgi:ABC-type sugar transport system ATPase subunit
MKSISKRFYAVTALREVSLDLRRGEVHALVGENGAGKSTLMKILSGSYPSTSFEGEVEIEGQPVHFASTHDAEQAGIEMIYQEISLNPELSVAENIFLGKLPRRRLPWFIDWKRTHAWPGRRWTQVGLEVPPQPGSAPLVHQPAADDLDRQSPVPPAAHPGAGRAHLGAHRSGDRDPHAHPA